MQKFPAESGYMLQKCFLDLKKIKISENYSLDLNILTMENILMSTWKILKRFKLPNC